MPIDVAWMGLTSCMVNLQNGLSTMYMDGVYQLLHSGYIGVIPEVPFIGNAHTGRVHRYAFHNNQPKAAFRTGGIIVNQAL